MSFKITLRNIALTARLEPALLSFSLIFKTLRSLIWTEPSNHFLGENLKIYLLTKLKTV
jgi:hypothetical protein